MRGTAPSYGALSSFTQQSSSRIPHLKLHILAKRSASKPAPVRERIPQVPRRCLYTTSASQNLSGIFFRANENVGQSQTSTVTTPGTHARVKSPDVETSDTLDNILQQAHPERVLYALLSTQEGKRFTTHASDEAFAAALCSIDPWYLIEPFKDVYRYIKPSLFTQPRYGWVRAIEERFQSFAEQINEIIDLRRNAGHDLTKDACNHILHCARVLGHGPMARKVWQTMILDTDAQMDLDLQAYNCYMEAISWSSAFTKAEQWRLRVTPRTLGIRRSDNPSSDLSGHRTGRLGLRHETLMCFRRMAGQNLEGNEETFTNIMIAMGREGDVAGAKSILKSVYNIDVDLLLEVDEEEVETPTFYESDSPLRPTNRLLYTITHVFGSNNDIGIAFKLVDFVSRQYDLRISFNVWMHLFDWAFVLSLRRSGAKKKQSQAIGIVPHSILDTLWTEMTDEPHNIKPNVVMHTLLARSLRDRGLLRQSLESIQKAKQLFEHDRGEAERLGKELLSLTDRVLTHQAASLGQVLPAEWFDLRRRFILSSIIEARDLQLLIVAIRLTFTEDQWPEHGRYKGWERRRLPGLIAELTEYLPNTLTYRTGDGLIEIAGLKSDRVAIARSGMRMSRRNGLLRAHLDRDIATVGDLFEARQRLKAEMDEIERLNELYARAVE